MISIYKIDKEITKVNEGQSDIYISTELRGLSRDTKPTEISGKKIYNGSVFFEIDTGDVYIYDLEGETWNKIS